MVDQDYCHTAHKNEPPRSGRSEGVLCLSALVMVVKPLAQVIGQYLRCDSHDKVDQYFGHAAHLLSVARLEKGSMVSITYPTDDCNFRRRRESVRSPLDPQMKSYYNSIIQRINIQIHLHKEGNIQ